MIAIFGGSFDPPTLGHLMVVSHLLLNEPDVERVLVIPCFQQTGKNLTPFEERLRMCELMFGVLNRVTVSDVESTLPPEHAGQTVELLKNLKKLNPLVKYRFVMGADLLASAPTWEGWDEVREMAPPLVIGRAGVPSLSVDAPSPICPLVSSTIVRTALKERRYSDVERYLTEGVLGHIKERALYQGI